MKHLLSLLATVALLTSTAQTLQAPIPIDWRYTLYWEDPNPPGTVTAWNVLVTSPTGVNRTFATRITSIDCDTLLNGLPPGSYALSTVAISSLGDVSPPSSNFWVQWPGGNGRVSPGRGHGVRK